MTTAHSPIRVGIIGVGNWARHGHLRVLNLLPQYHLQAVYSERRERAEAAASEYAISQVADSVDALVNNGLNRFRPSTKQGVRLLIERE